MPRYELEWKSSVEERYDSDMLDKGEDWLKVNGIKVVEVYGGSDGYTADNGYTIEAPENIAQEAQKRLRHIVGHDLTLKEA